MRTNNRHGRVARASLLLAAVSFPLAARASTYTVETDLFDYYSFGGPGANQDIKDTAETGATEASTVASTPPGNTVQDPYVDLNAYAAGDHAAAHLEADATFSRSHAYNNPSGFDSYRSSSSVDILLTDVVISGPSAVSTSINFLIDGSIQAGSTNYVGTDVDAGADISATVRVNGYIIGTGDYQMQSINGNPPYGPVGGGLFANYTGHTVATTSSITLPVNTPVTVEFQVGMLVSGGLNEDSAGLATSVASFGNTFSFATDRPVFNLPVGYTVDSPSAGLVANTYVGFPTPEPTSLAILAAATPLLLRRRKR